MASDGEWVSWFGKDGVARHYRSDSPIGQEIVRRLSEAASANMRVCNAPKALFPDQECGERFVGRKGMKFCSKACALRAQRASR